MARAYIGRGTKLSIFAELDEHDVSDEFEAVYKYHESDTIIAVHCAGLYDIYDSLGWDARLQISFSEELKTYTFTGRAMEKKRGSSLILIERLSEIEAFDRRRYERDELRVSVRVYGLPKADLESRRYERPAGEPDLLDTTFDISVGGLCIITDNLLSSEFDPFYLTEFSISSNDRFLMPAKLVRRSTLPRTKIGKYDYGFQFIFDKLLEEKGRLARSILRKKLSFR